MDLSNLSSFIKVDYRCFLESLFRRFNTGGKGVDSWVVSSTHSSTTRILRSPMPALIPCFRWWIAVPYGRGHDATESAESRSLTGRAYGPLDHQSFLTSRSWLFYSWACSYKHSDGVEQRDSPAGRQWQRRGWDDMRKAILYIDKVWYSLTKIFVVFQRKYPLWGILS